MGRRGTWIVIVLVAAVALVVACVAAVRQYAAPEQQAQPVLVVKIDNVPAARPPTGLGAADLVYVEPVEGGLNRLAAVFVANKPPVVGPVRSARETDLLLLPEFGRPTLAFSGAAPELVPRIDQASLVNASAERIPDAYFRDDSRPVPHNLYVRPEKLPPGEAWSPSTAFQFGAAPAGGAPTTHREVRYTSSSVAFDWSPEENRWVVSMDGEPYTTTDTGRAAASTVIVQAVPVRESSFKDSLGSSSPLADTVGEGTATVLRDGRAFEARWSRPSVNDPTRYTTPSGEPFPLAPGQVWTVLTAS